MNKETIKEGFNRTFMELKLGEEPSLVVSSAF